jgi:beta-galactosidase GanA
MTTHSMEPNGASGWSIAQGDGFHLAQAGRPALLLGGQVHNSSSSSRTSIADSFAHVRRMNGNTVLAPVSWALLEPEEGTFDLSLVDAMLEEARSNGLRLVLLWFGAFKNAASTYAPSWVRADTERFPRAVVGAQRRTAFTYPGATPKPVLSVFSRDLRDADAAAFETLMRHLVVADADHTVAMVQVENESGLLSDSRDRGPLAERAWNAAVPEGLLDRLGSGGSSAVHDLWRERGAIRSGSWPEVFGDDPRADEVFMAWAFSTYVEHLARRGRAIKRVPMYANAWLGPQPGQDDPGQYPSGGPASRVIEVWRAGAPSLDLLGPDLYVDDADSAMRAYASADQPLFIPECRLRAGELVRAIGTYGAIGWSAFGVDRANPAGQVAAVLAYLTALESTVTAAGRRGALAAVIVEPGQQAVQVRIQGGLEVTARGTLALLQQMLLDAGVQAPAPELSLPDETLPTAPVPTAADTRPFGFLIAEASDTFIVVGQGATIDFAAEGAVVEIDSVQELLLESGSVVPGRVINGDERLAILPTHGVGAARVRLLRRKP